MNMHARVCSLMLVLSSSPIACSDDDDADGRSGEGADVEFGETAIVVVVNPAVNDGHTQAVPTSLGTRRSGVAIEAEPGGDATTAADGLAVIGGLAQGELELTLDGEPRLPFSVVADGDVYDLAVAYDGDDATAFENFRSAIPSRARSSRSTATATAARSQRRSIRTTTSCSSRPAASLVTWKSRATTCFSSERGSPSATS
jgi:hypothetical protein